MRYYLLSNFIEIKHFHNPPSPHFREEVFLLVLLNLLLLG